MTRSWKLRFTSLYLRNWLLFNSKPLLPKNAFCINVRRRIWLALENCVLLEFVLKTGFYQIFNLCSQKMCFAFNLRKEYNLPLKTACNSNFCWKLPVHKFKLSFAKICVLRQISRKNTTRSRKLHLTPVYDGNWFLPNVKTLLPNTAFFLKTRLKSAFETRLC